MGIVGLKNNIEMKEIKTNLPNGRKVNIAFGYADTSIGELLNKHADEEGIAYLNQYSQYYLTEKEEEMFVKLCECTDGSHLTGEFGDDGDVNVHGNENAYYTCYDYNYPAVDVYREMLSKMRREMNYYMMGLKINSYSDFRVWKSDDYSTFMTLDIFANDYDVDIDKGFDYCKGWYIDVVGNE